MPREILARSTKFIKLVVPAGQPAGSTVSSPLPQATIGAQFVVRQVAVTSDNHDIDRLVSVFIGGVTFIDHLPDQQGYETAPLDNPENDVLFPQHAVFKAQIEIATGGTPASDATYLIALEYWVVQP